MSLHRVIAVALVITLSMRTLAGKPSDGRVSSEEPAYFITGKLTFQDRVWAQAQIERVYYNHRIWPQQNPGPKPPFETVMPGSIIEAKVADSLAKSTALELYWRHPITGEMLQAELERMASQTRDPDTLRELFAALRNNPRLIAETLARESLADRLIRNWYAYDRHFHAENRAHADAIAKLASDRRQRSGVGRTILEADLESWRALGGEYHHQVIHLSEEPWRPPPAGGDDDERWVDAEEFAILERTPPGIDISIEGDAVRASARVEETADHFIVRLHQVRMDERRIERDFVTVPKKSFADWWSGVGRGIGVLSIPDDSGFETLFVLPRSIDAAGCDEWNFAPNLYLAPEARRGHSAVWTGVEMIIWGGYSAYYGYLGSGARYNPSTDSWTPTAIGGNAPSPRADHAAVWSGTEMILWGGSTGGVAYQITGGRYDPAGDSWQSTSTSANTPAGRSGNSAIWTGTALVIWGGADSLDFRNTGGRYYPATDSWLPTSLGAGVPAGRRYHTAVWSGSKMIVWGGYAAGSYLNDGGRYDPATDNWLPTSLGVNNPAGRENHVSIWSGSEMIVWGGDDGGGVKNSGGRYNPVNDTWLPTSTGANLPAARRSATAVWTGTQMIVWGGTAGSVGLASGGRYSPAGDVWQPVSTGPAGRFSHSAVWTGTEMIVWGGAPDGSNPLLSTGGRYNPVSDSWVPTPTGSAIPAARAYHTAIWSGTEMIVWGGMSATTQLNSGGRYVPATDVWSPTSTGSNVPAGRYNHTAVWSGSEMIVWGGGLFPYLNTGGRYNPATDSWQSTAGGPNLPAARYGHTAIWSGTEMIVWGGGNSTGSLNSGGRYDPVADSWKATSTGANVPAARYTHTAVWSGSEMLVWGGNALNTGGRYDPVGDSWQPISTGANVPVGRSYHTAIWTGTEMVVWGGQNFSPTVLNSGGRYDARTNSWRSTSVGANVPAAREYHTAVWTNAEMIVWGGAAGASYLNTGGRYDPVADGWQPTSIGANRPAFRAYHSAVWTGSQMIVWGGTHGVVLNNGGSYGSGTLPGPGNSLRGGKSATIDLSWSSIPGAVTYNVKRCDPAATPCIPGAIVSTPAINQYSESEDGVSHFYAVESVNLCGASP